MKNTDKSRSKVFGFIHFGKHTKDNISNRMKETIEQGSILKEINTKFFRDSEDTMTVDTGNKFAGHVKRTLLIIAVATRRAETALTAESDELEIFTVRAPIHGTTVRRVTTMKHLVDILDNRWTWMKFVNHMFIIIIKYVL